MRRLVLGSLVLALCLGSPLPSDGGMEARCNAMGSECVCSEPLAAVNYVKVASQISNPDDTTASDKQCTYEGAPTGGCIVWCESLSNLTSVTAATEPAAFAALPAGHSLTRIAKEARVAPNNECGVLGHRLTNNSQFLGWFAIRWYQFYSSNFQFSGDGSCQNHKLANFDFQSNFSYLTHGNSEILPTADIINSNLSALTGVDCCVKGPAGAAGGGDEDVSVGYKGKWWRFEVIVIRRAGPGLHILAYEKNITDNGPELKRVDTRINGSCFGPSCQWTRTGGVTPPSIVNGLTTDWHRFQTCNGYRTVTHFMTAGSNNPYTGQRIGAATEVEGGSGGVPPSSPQNFRLTFLLRDLLARASGMLLRGFQDFRAR